MAGKTEECKPFHFLIARHIKEYIAKLFRCIDSVFHLVHQACGTIAKFRRWFKEIDPRILLVHNITERQRYVALLREIISERFNKIILLTTPPHPNLVIVLNPGCM